MSERREGEKEEGGRKKEEGKRRKESLTCLTQPETRNPKPGTL